MSLQGLMFGYATDETPECMPLTLLLAHRLNARIAQLRRSGVLAWARPDSKSQVCGRACSLYAGRHVHFSQMTIAYKVDRGAMKPQRVHTIVISVQHDANTSLEQVLIYMQLGV